ncbi:hypothetical protein BCV70DRAFT_197614 [Testicularia cyperi]|uniref:Secreted protein n=1 Tax=Testicularia cyperi TaxID=1882483 RepID=A0A317Y197_9BASI|nr:hypothetical protein BCV70DRAFT_197614 [Testicularia cyperi]
MSSSQLRFAALSFLIRLLSAGQLCTGSATLHVVFLTQSFHLLPSSRLSSPRLCFPPHLIHRAASAVHSPCASSLLHVFIVESTFTVTLRFVTDIVVSFD